MIGQSGNIIMQRRFSEKPPQRRFMKPNNKALITWNILAACYYFYCTSVGCGAQATDKKYLDLSHTFDENTLYWVTTKQLNLTITHNGTDPTGQYWYQSDEIAAGTHGGTHMDSPCHFAVGQWCVSDIPMDRLIVPAVVVDISHDVQDNPKVHLSPEHLMDWEKRHEQIPDGSLVLVRTGWARYWPNRLRYTGTTERNVNLLKFPSITPEAGKWLAKNRNIAGIGIDTMSIDIATGTREVHIALLGKNIYGLENVNLIDPLPPTGMTAYVMPMKLKDASGAPCRVFLEVQKDAMKNGNVGSANSVSIIWTTAVLAAFAWTFS